MTLYNQVLRFKNTSRVADYIRLFHTLDSPDRLGAAPAAALSFQSRSLIFLLQSGIDIS